MINFGVQLGGGNSREKIQPLHIDLNKIFNESKQGYFKTIETFGIYFRVEGPLKKFGEEGPDSLEYLKKNKELGIDFVVKENVWKQNNKQGLIDFFTVAIKDCFNILLEDAKRRGFVNDEKELVKDFTVKLNEFRGMKNNQ
jgi:hypothetical protein